MPQTTQREYILNCYRQRSVSGEKNKEDGLSIEEGRILLAQLPHCITSFRTECFTTWLFLNLAIRWNCYCMTSFQLWPLPEVKQEIKMFYPAIYLVILCP